MNQIFRYALCCMLMIQWIQAAESSQPADLSGVWTSTATIDEFDSRTAQLTLTKKEDKWAASMINENGEKTELTRVVQTGKTLSIEFDMERDGQKGVIGAKAELDKEGTLKGTWYAKDGDGFELMSNQWTAFRSLKATLAGTWQVTAKTDNGDMNHEMVMTQKGSTFEGVAISSEGEAPFSHLKIDKHHLSMQVAYAGGTVKIKSKLIAKNRLEGKWVYQDEFDQEVANGAWIASKSEKK